MARDNEMMTEESSYTVAILTQILDPAFPSTAPQAHA